ncbi:Alpha/Beta hydrolase protein [Mycena belliarum]|uniref:Alpha/Beta hydrolase protein n=1 Tax=Mycena belliarum TaxID=1033014 RepID=A0AAD6TL94_9AGAR|nr:Alpha/Beta hydrolase protein [Mycena belliae]
MPSFTLHSGVEFFYTDSGNAIVGDNYTTFVIIHGHTFHSGTFKRLIPHAAANSLRIISVNRRCYPGSSSFSAEELSGFNQGTEVERATLLEQQGVDLALLLDGLIVELSIPQSGGIALIGWSMGAIFMLSLIASVSALPVPTKDRLSSFVRTVVLLQTPSLALGLPPPPGWLIPHTDPTIAPEARGAAFAKWVSSYFIHGDLSTRKLENLTYDNTDPRRLSTIEALTPEDLMDIADFSPGEKYDNIVGLSPFERPVFEQTRKALFDLAVRRAWSGAKFWNVYGSAEPWNIIHAAWFLEDQSRAADAPEVAIHFKIIDGINHFLVWEDPERAIQELKDCLSV